MHIDVRVLFVFNGLEALSHAPSAYRSFLAGSSKKSMPWVMSPIPLTPPLDGQ